MTHTQSVSLSEEIAAPAAAVWELLIDWPAIIDWMPEGQIERLEMEGQGVGSVRRMVTSQGVLIAERLDAADPRTGTLDLSILEPLPWGMLSYSARGIVMPLAEDHCRLTWTGTFELPARGEDSEALAGFLKQLYGALFGGVRQATGAKDER